MGGILATSAAPFCCKVANSVFLNQLKLGHSGYSGPDNGAVLPVLTQDDGKDDDDGTDDKDKDNDKEKGKDEAGWGRL